jgi:gentisate 1,2-dioxygenase
MHSQSAPPLLDALAAAHTVPLWDRYKQLNTREPHVHTAMHWPWATMAPLVERASREVNMNEAERRALLFTHPDWPGTVFTTPTLSGALQILLPGESAPPHRHTLAALRLVMTGSGAVTIVDGKRCVMEPGDLVLTPAWSWHEHVHEGDEPMVWFDGLDYPLARQLHDVFFEHGPGPKRALGLADLPDAALGQGGLQPQGSASVTPYSPLYRYPYTSVDQALAALPAAADGSRLLRYTNPVDGGAVMPTIDCYALRLTAGAPTRPSRTTATAMGVVIDGEGEVQIGELRFAFRPHDVFTLPRWAWTEFRARGGAATLFLMSDRELLRRLDHLKEETA